MLDLAEQVRSTVERAPRGIGFLVGVLVQLHLGVGSPGLRVATGSAVRAGERVMDRVSQAESERGNERVALALYCSSWEGTRIDGDTIADRQDYTKYTIVGSRFGVAVAWSTRDLAALWLVLRLPTLTEPQCWEAGVSPARSSPL